jgi:YVTN family beta-propeller protein
MVEHSLISIVIALSAAFPQLAEEGSRPATVPPASEEARYLAENDAAMMRMMKGMTVAPLGDVDRDFVAMMVPHHQGAIDMAVAVLRHGRNEQVKRLAQEIIVTQQEEIASMRLAVGDALPLSRPSPTGPAEAAVSGQAPGRAADPDVPVSHRDRIYAAEQFSNTVSVTDPADNKLLGVIRLGDPNPSYLSPLYKGQLLVHGLGFSPDHKTLAVVSIGSNSVTFIDTATNSVKRVAYVGRSPHEAFFTPDGSEVWVTVRGEDYVEVIDARTFEEKTRIKVMPGPGMQIFSPDGRYGYVCSSFNPETAVIAVADHRIVGRVTQASPFCPNIAVTPDGSQVWFTLKDVGKAQVFDGRPPFALLKTLDTGPLTNHVNFAHNSNGTFAYVTIGGLNQIKVFRTEDFQQVATISVGNLPHGLWPSGDGSRVYVGLENADALAAIDTLTNKVVANIPIGQAPQALVYVPNAVPEGDGTQNLQPLGIAGEATHLALRRAGDSNGQAVTSVSLFDQGLSQVLQAAVTGLTPKQPYALALASRPDGSGSLQPLAAFTTNPAGSAVVSAVGPIRQLVLNDAKTERRYLVIVSGSPAKLGEPVQVQVP